MGGKSGWIAWGVVLASGALAAVANFPYGILVDDAFITFRYAENLAAGTGFVYNGGEQHLGVTCPLYGLLLGALVALTGASATTLAFWVNLVAVTGFGAVVFALLRDAPLRGVAAFAPWVLLSFWTAGLTVGMESVLFVTVGFSCVLIWQRSAARPALRVLLGAVAGALCLLRPDGIFLAAVLFLATWSRDRRFPLGAVIAGGAVLGAWATFATLNYGGPVPDTVGAKVAQARTALWPVGFLEAMWTEMLPARILWFAGAAVIGVVLAVRTRQGAVVMVAIWMVIHNGAYIVSHVPPYPWYYVPLLAQLVFLTAFVIAKVPLARFVGRAEAAVALGLIAAGVAVLTALGWTRIERRVADVQAGAFHPTRHAYYRLGRWLERHTAPDAKIGAMEVGMLGYYSKRYIVDYLGLVTPGLSGGVYDLAHIDRAMRWYRPDYLIVSTRPSGHDVNLAQFIVSDYFPVHLDLEYVVLKRRALDEAALAERAATALAGRTGVVSFGDFPRLLDFDAFTARLRERGASVTMRRWPTADTTAVIRLGRDGRVTVRPATAPAASFDRAALAAWSPGAERARVEREGEPCWRVLAPLGFVWRPVEIKGPIRRVRIRLRVDPVDPQRTAGAGKLWWAVTDPPAGKTGERDSHSTFFIPATGKSVDVSVDFHDGGPTAEQVLTMLRVDLFDAPAIVTLEGMWLDRG